jgi:hypothetical protein
MYMRGFVGVLKEPEGPPNRATNFRPIATHSGFQLKMSHTTPPMWDICTPERRF